MLTDILNKNDRKYYIILFFIVLAILLVDSSYSPVNFKRMHVDSSAYVTIAQGISRGYLPYRDFVDNKGPLLYLISVPGLLLGRFTGIWITELILMLVSVYFAYKTALFFSDKYKALLGTIFSFVALHSSFFVNAGTEEYSMPFLMISLYIFTKYYFSQNHDVSFRELVILGACFTCAVFIKLNMFPLWVGFCIIIFLEEILHRSFLRLCKYIFGFCLGIIIILVPIFLYLKLNGIINDFLYQVIIGGAARGFNGGGGSNLKELFKNFYMVLNRYLSIIPLIIGVFCMITKFKQKKIYFYAGYTLSYFLMVLFLAFAGGSEILKFYNMILVPFFVPALVVLADILDSAFSATKNKKAILLLFFCIIFSERLLTYLDDLSEIGSDNSGTQLIKAGNIINENTKPSDKIISLGGNSYIYPFTQRNAASKYIFQGGGLNNHIIGAQEEFISDILTNKPAIIAIFTVDGEDERSLYSNGWFRPIIEMIDNGEYRLLSDENGFKLFIKN